MLNKRGQVAIFVIMAMVIVAVILAVFLYPRAGPGATTEFTPTSYLKSCIEPEIRKNLEVLGRNGGYLNPEGALEYQGEKIKYLCYTSEFYKTCVVQQPLLKEHIENELTGLLKSRAGTCLDTLKQELEKRNYQVSIGQGESKVSIIPGSIEISYSNPITLTKESSQRFDGFKTEINSQMYDLILTAISILDYETTFGDSETTLYLRYYPDLRMEKIKLSDGSKVYLLTNVVTNESLRFASRSLSWPPGYGLE